MKIGGKYTIEELLYSAVQNGTISLRICVMYIRGDITLNELDRLITYYNE